MLFPRIRILGALIAAGLFGTVGCHGGGSSGSNSGSSGGVGGHPQPVAGHPRLWVNAQTLPDLQSRATAANPLYAQGLQKVAVDYKAMMDGGKIPVAANDCADASGYGGVICEWLMEVFGLMSLVAADPMERDDYAHRARTLLMNIVEKAKQGPLAGDPLRDPSFPVRDRAHEAGEAFGLTVDWIYPYLSATDKADILQVFLAWADADVHATITTDNHPEPIGVFNDPVLLADKIAVRFSGNNYFCSHARNLGLMAMALDPTDDPAGKLHAYLDNATGAFLYMTDALLRGESRGGLLPEGNEYDLNTLGYITELLLALHTAGLDDASKRGQQVVMASNPFYTLAPDVYLHQLTPEPTPLKFPGPYYGYHTFGDLETYEPYGAPLGDPIRGLAPIGILARDAGDMATYDKIRWIQYNMPPDLHDGLTLRAGNDYTDLWTISYFLLMDPKAGEGTDPRPAMPKSYWSDGLNFLFARTGWGPMESYFAYQLEWTQMDHHHADDNHFSFFRKGEWITMERAGYTGVFFTGPMHNNVAVENDPPVHVTDGLTMSLYQTGSQWVYEGGGDGKVLGHSVTPDYAYVLGDATDMHNSATENSTSVTHLSRSILWLQPDHVITYDRVATKNAGRFKRVYLQLPGTPQVNGTSAQAQTAGGQGIFYTSLLPQNAVLSSDPPPADKPAQGEPMSARLLIEAPDKPAAVRFLGVLQGADAGASADPATLVIGEAGTLFEGVLVKGAAVLFPVDPSAALTSLTFTVPATTARFYVTGLSAGGKYDVATTPAGPNVTVKVQPGSAKTADGGGVLAF